MSRNIVATVRPSGNAGDQEDTTAVTATVTNSSGVTAVTTVAIANQALGNCGLGSQEFDAVELFAKASVTFSGGGTLLNAAAVMVVGAAETDSAIDASGDWEAGGAQFLTPGGGAWTGTLLDSALARVEAEVSLPAGASATISVPEIRAEAVDFFQLAYGRAGARFARGRVA